MARVNISIPDDLYRRAKDADLNVSRLTRQAIVEELSNRARIVAAYEHLEALERELGPITPADQARADAAVDRILARLDNPRATA